MKCGIVFSGQGSQYPMMGYSIYNKYDYIKMLYKTASDILGYDLTTLCFTENDLLNQTIYTQPAMLITEIALYEVLKKEFNVSPDILSGFSLGEYTALYAAGIFDFETIFKIVKIRANSMNLDSLANPGKMIAILGMTYSEVENICASTSDVYIANYNSLKQIVVSGTVDAINILVEKLKTTNARRVIPLNVSGAFHSPLMNNASLEVYNFLEKVSLNDINIPVLLNLNAKEANKLNLKEHMRDQITNPVLFHDIITKLINDYDLDTIIEIGPGNVLTNLIKKYDNNINLINIDKIEDYQLLYGGK